MKGTLELIVREPTPIHGIENEGLGNTFCTVDFVGFKPPGSENI